MRTASRLAVLAASALGVLGVVAAPAGLALADESAQQTIDRLQSEGYTVNIDRLGTGPLSDCVVTNIRNPQQVTQWLPAVGTLGRGNDRTVLVETVVSKSISVSLNCS